MANNGSYSNERPPIGGGEIDYATDPASGGFFNSDYKKKPSSFSGQPSGNSSSSLLHQSPMGSGLGMQTGLYDKSNFNRHDDLKQMLDANKDGLKLEAMKRIIGMVAKGRDASELFPAVVKNVVSKNIEVKKLVYVYLVRYAEEQQDLALLSISTFQRALKDPNQLIRASALRVLSSIRVPVIVPIVMLAIKDSASDMSPYVRKTAAHAIPKLYSLDPEQKEELVHLIEKLLSDKTTLVVGSAVMAFEEVCPERIDLIHKNYRKLCNLLVDVDEWGQVVIINMLTRYARTQFVDPNKFDGEEENENKPFYEDEEIDGANGNEDKPKKQTYSLDPDYRLLLKNAKPLLQSRNASVVMAVAQLYHHLAPRGEVTIIAKSLVRLLRSHREVQSVVLNCIASVSTQRKGMFEPYLKSFFVRTSDATHIKLLKLEILTNLATETSISVILREFQTYISSPDKEFVAAAIQAIGRCASNIKEVTDSCLTGLVSMLSNRDEAVVAESVVVIKKLLQSQPSRHRDIIRSMARLMDTIAVPAARASILWLLGEYSELVPTIAPDVLRKMAKSFINEEDIVKLQVLNLAVKLFLNNPSQTRLLCQYVFSLARYDQNYDIRDRSRFLRQFIFPINGDNKLSSHAKKIFLATKPAPLLQSKFINREPYQMGSLSHYLNTRTIGYHDLPPFPDVAPDPSARNVLQPSPPPQSEISHVEKKPSKTKSFYEESDSSPADEESDSSVGESSKGEEEESAEEGSDDESSEAESSSETESEPTPIPEKNTSATENAKRRTTIVASESDNVSSELSSSEEDSDSDSSTEKTPAKKPLATKEPAKPQSNLDLLLDLDDIAPSTPIMTPSLGGFLTPLSPMPSQDKLSVNTLQMASPSYIPLKRFEVLNKVNGGGLGVEARFTRQPHLYSPTMTNVELTFTNHSTTENFTDIKVYSKNLPSGISMHDFAPISALFPQATTVGTIGVDWNDSTQPVTFEISWSEGIGKLSVRAPVGELIRAVTMPHWMFTTEQGKLKGMNEHSIKVSLTRDKSSLPQRIYEVCNVALLPAVEPLIYRFCGQTMSSRSLVFLTLKFDSLESNEVEVIVNCEKLVIGSILLNEVKSALKS